MIDHAWQPRLVDGMARTSILVALSLSSAFSAALILVTMVASAAASAAAVVASFSLVSALFVAWRASALASAPAYLASGIAPSSAWPAVHSSSCSLQAARAAASTTAPITGALREIVRFIMRPFFIAEAVGKSVSPTVQARPAQRTCSPRLSLVERRPIRRPRPAPATVLACDGPACRPPSPGTAGQAARRYPL